MSPPDLIIIILLVLFALGGLRRGLVWELLTVFGLLLGFGLTYYYRAELADIALRLTRPGWERQWGGTLVFLVFFLVIYIGFSILGHRAHKAIDNTRLKVADRALGAFGGALKGAVLIGLAVVLIDYVDSTARVRHFLWDSNLVRWGRRAVYNIAHWESSERRKWVMAGHDLDAPELPPVAADASPAGSRSAV